MLKDFREVARLQILIEEITSESVLGGWVGGGGYEFSYLGQSCL